MNPLETRLKAHGFTLQETGGGCTAYIRTDKITQGALEEFITLEDPIAPTMMNQQVTVSTTDELTKDLDITTGYTLADVLRALEHPSDEYYLLSLRLENGLGKEAKL